MDYGYFSPHCCKCNSFGCTVAIRCGNARHGPHSHSVYSGSERSHFKREAGFPNPRRALIGSNQIWRVNDSPNYRELCNTPPRNNMTTMGKVNTSYLKVMIRRVTNGHRWIPRTKASDAELWCFTLFCHHGPIGPWPYWPFVTMALEAETKLPSFRTRHFQMHFLEWFF